MAGNGTYNFRSMTLNVRGLRDERKRVSVYNYIKKHKIDMCFLQETHSTEADINTWKHQWGGHVEYSHGTNLARGVMCLLNPSLDYNIIEVQQSDRGRWLLIRVEIQGTNFVLINIYAPNIQEQQLVFYTELFDLLSNIESNDYVMMGGDFNVIFNPLLDRKGGHFIESSKYRAILNKIDDIINEHQLCDIYRIKNPLHKRFTWRQKNPLIQSRLDVWLINEHLQDYTVQVEVIPSIKSDHSAVILEINTDFVTERGKGYWRMNNKHLDESEYITGISKGILEWKIESQLFQDNRQIWEYIKYKIREYSTLYGKQRSNKNKMKEKSLEHDLKMLDEQLDSQQGENKSLEDRRIQMKTELEQLDDGLWQT